MPGTEVRFTLKDNLGEAHEKTKPGQVSWYGFCLNPHMGLDAEKACAKMIAEQTKDGTSTTQSPSVDRLVSPDKPEELKWLQGIMTQYGAKSWWGGLKTAAEDMKKGCRFTTAQGTATETSCETPRAFVCGWAAPR